MEGSSHYLPLMQHKGKHLIVDISPQNYHAFIAQLDIVMDIMQEHKKKFSSRRYHQLPAKYLMCIRHCSLHSNTVKSVIIHNTRSMCSQMNNGCSLLSKGKSTILFCEQKLLSRIKGSTLYHICTVNRQQYLSPPEHNCYSACT